MQGNKLAQKHGLSHTRLHRIWHSMYCRCYYPSTHGYERYGGRGIKICDEWINNPQSFYDWAINNGYSDNLSIDRINVNGNYEPSNCRWADKKTQARNTRGNHFYTYKGETKTIAEWAEIKGIAYKCLWNRIKRNYPEDKIFL